MSSQPGPLRARLPRLPWSSCPLSCSAPAPLGNLTTPTSPSSVCPAGGGGLLTGLLAHCRPSPLPQMRGHIPEATSKVTAGTLGSGGTTQTLRSPRYQSYQSPRHGPAWKAASTIRPAPSPFITGCPQGLIPDQVPVPSLGLSFLLCRA